VGKKTKNENLSIDINLDRQINLAQFLAERNSRFRKFHKNFPNRFVNEVFDRFPGIDYKEYYKEYDQKFAQIWGDIIPTFPWPVQKAKLPSQDSSDLILKINLNFTKDEIMHRVRQFVEMELKKRLKIRRIIQRKIPAKWLDCLEVWDLRNGYEPWIRDSFGPYLPSYKKSKRRWKYEEIAKYKNPDALSPEELAKAKDKVKKQYRAAFKLIYGKRYKKLSQYILRAKRPKLCDKCPDKLNCKEKLGCPQLIEELDKLEGKQQDRVLENIDFFSSGAPSPEEELMNRLGNTPNA
jgi:hypothetical protein